MLLLYVDGLPVDKAEDTATGRLNTTADIVIGNVLSNPKKVKAIRREVGEVRIWNHFREPELVSTFHNRRLEGNEPGLIGYYRLDKSVGLDDVEHPIARLNGTDWTKSPVPMTPLNARKKATAPAANFLGDGGHIAFGRETRGIDFPMGFTIEAWGNPRGTDQEIFECPIVSSHGPGTGSELRCSAGQAEFMVTTDRRHRHATSPIPRGQWVHVAGVFEPNLMRLYVNGVLTAQTAAPGKLTPCPDMLRIGHNLSMPDRRFNGLLAEIRLWGRPRRGQEIVRDLFRRLNGESEIGLVAYWPLDKVGKDNQILDESPSQAIHGTLVGVELIDSGLPPCLPAADISGTQTKTRKKSETQLLALFKKQEAEIASLRGENQKLISALNSHRERITSIDAERRQLESIVLELQPQVDRLFDLESNLAQSREKEGAVPLDFFISQTREQIQQARNRLGGSYRLGDVSMGVQMLPASDGGAAIFPSKDELKELKGSLSTLRLNFDEEPPAEPPKPPMIVVPNLNRQTETMARRTLAEVGLLIEINHEAITKDAARGEGIDLEGRVVNQFPRSPTEVAPGSTILVFIGRLS